MKTLCSILLGTLLAQIAPGQDYEIRLHRPQREGEKYRITSVGRQFEDSSMTSQGKVLRANKKDATIQLEGVVTVLAVSTNGKAIKQSVAIDKLTSTADGKTTALLGKGATVIGYYSGPRKVFEMDGKPVDPALNVALGTVVDIERPGPTDDELFGTRQRKKVGESWPVNGALLARHLSKDNPVQIQDISGKATLKEVVQQAGGPVLVITMDATARVGPGITPPNFALQKAASTFRASGRFPVNVALGKPEDSMEMTLTLHAKGKPQPDTPEVEIKMDGKQSVVIKRTPVR